MTYTHFAQRITAVAGALGDGRCDGSYAEACILLSALISGVASHLVPGTGLDKKRFVEVWVRHADSALRANMISLPLLYAHAVDHKDKASAEALQKVRALRLGKDARIVTQDEIDADEQEVVGLTPSLTTKLIRQHSYPALFYRMFRSGLVHEYEVTGRATQRPMTERRCGVSYSNYLSAPTGRRIHFHLPWLIDVATSIARNASPHAPLAAHPNLRPTKWWLDG